MKNWFWFIAFVLIFAGDCALRYVHLWVYSPVTEDNYIDVVQLYTAIRGMIAGFLYFTFIFTKSYLKRFKMDRIDEMLAALCGCVSIISGSRYFFGQVYWEPNLLWWVFGIFFTGLLIAKIGTYR